MWFATLSGLGIAFLAVCLWAVREQWLEYTAKVEESRYHRHLPTADSETSQAICLRLIAERAADASARYRDADRTQELVLAR